MSSRYTSQDTESYYDKQDAIYRSFWDEGGSVHWGIFDGTTGNDFLAGCENLNEIMVKKGAVGRTSKVLDFGCGNGTTALWLSNEAGCHVTGVDLSGVRVDNALKALEDQTSDLKSRVRFEKASVTELPFEDSSFTHVWSQAVIYHVHDKEDALKEAYRVLADGGIFVFDDLIKPQPNISDAARTYVYERLFYDTDFSFNSYQDSLKKVGFEVLEADDLSEHLKTSYTCLADMTREMGNAGDETYQKLSYAYEQTVKAVENDELGWGMYVCRK